MKRFTRLCALALAAAMALTTVGCSSEETVECYGIHTQAQADYLAGDYKMFKEYANGTEELSAPVPIMLPLDGRKNKRLTLMVSEYSDMQDALVVDTETDPYPLYNLKIGTTYYYRVLNSYDPDKVHSFTTEDIAPRNLYIDGVTNVRDLGGWHIGDTKRVRQGMLLRSSKFNADESADVLITSVGIATMTRELGVKTEIDLRTVNDNENGGITQSPLGNGVTYISVPIVSGGNIIQMNRDRLADLFTVLGDENNYPIVFHCSIGTDRTGMLAFLINGLLGVSEEDLYRDFLFSNFGNIGKLRTPSIIEKYQTTVEMSTGSTLSERIYSYLVSVGVAEEDLDTVIRIMTEDRPGAVIE